MEEKFLLNVKKKDIQIFVKHRDFEEDFTGPVDQVLRALIVFFYKIYPSLDLLNQILFTVDIQMLLEQMKDVIAISPRGPIILYKKKKLSAKELLGLNLIGAYVAYKLSLLEKDSMSLDHLIFATGKTKGSVSGTLTSLINDSIVEKPERGEYKISLLGIKYFMEEVFPKLK